MPLTAGVGVTSLTLFGSSIGPPSMWRTSRCALELFFCLVRRGRSRDTQRFQTTPVSDADAVRVTRRAVAVPAMGDAPRVAADVAVPSMRDATRVAADVAVPSMRDATRVAADVQ